MTKSTPFHFSNFFKDTGIYESLLSKYDSPWKILSYIDDFINNFKETEQSKDYTEIEEGVFIGKDVKIDSSSKIEGKAIIGHNSTIGHAAFLRGGVLMGENVHIGHAVELKHSLILSDTALAHLNYVGDSIVGSNCNISGGVILANSRLDKKEILIKNGEETISTGFEKLGSILGDGCFIGANAVLNPGTVIAQNSKVFPLVSLRGTHLSTNTFK